MAEMTGKSDYMANEYVAYQRKYRDSPRESDKILIRLIQNNLKDLKDKELLDIGCHNGNLLFHIRRNIPELRLFGGDLFPEVVAQCRTDPELSGISFDVLDIRNMDREPVDVIVTSAILARFSDIDHELIWKSLFERTKPGGFVVSFDWYVPFRQTLKIIEETDTHPDGLTLNFRSEVAMSGTLKRAGFVDADFYPFKIGIDLPLNDPTDPLHTYTRTVTDGERLQFRGALYQPWCHLVARKAQ